MAIVKNKDKGTLAIQQPSTAVLRLRAQSSPSPTAIPRFALEPGPKPWGSCKIATTYWQKKTRELGDNSSI